MRTYTIPQDTLHRNIKMTSTIRKQVCLFGLSGDPPTGDCGHRGIATHLANMEEFDEVRILPVYSHFFDVRFMF